MSLSVCPGCSRHVRESTCPFCAAEVVHAPRAARPRVARIALLGAAAAVASACSSSPAPAYGAPPVDASTDATPSDAARGPDAIATFYGGVPVDSGSPSDAGGGD